MEENTFLFNFGKQTFNYEENENDGKSVDVIDYLIFAAIHVLVIIIIVIFKKQCELMKNGEWEAVREKILMKWI